MGKITRRQYFHLGCLALVLLFSLSSRSNAQRKVSLEIKVAAPDTAQGGETFEYTVTVTNKGAAKAMRVTQINHPAQSGPFLSDISGQSSKGECETSRYDPLRPVLRCEIGELEVGETVTVVVTTKLRDLGDISKSDVRGSAGSSIYWSNTDFRKRSYETLQNAVSNNQQSAAPVDERSSIIEAEVISEQEEETPEDNRFDIRAKLLPSKNIPPRVEVLSPKPGTAIVSPVGTRIKIPFAIKAFDPDGSIRKVVIHDDHHLPFASRYLEDDGTFRYIFNGQKYTQEKIQEVLNADWGKRLDQARSGESPFPEHTARATGKDIYEYTLTDYNYGENQVGICAIDDGGRDECTGLFYFSVKSDSEIKLTMPNRQVLPLSVPVVVETSSKVRPGINAKVLLYGMEGVQSSPQDPLLMRQTATGTTITHSITWTPTKEGYYRLWAGLFENGIETKTEATFTTYVAESRVIKITSLRNGQECSPTIECKIEVYARDAKGMFVRNDTFEIMLDGRSFGTIHDLDCGICEPKSRALTSMEKGAHTIQIVARADDHGPELGRSDVYTVFFK